MTCTNGQNSVPRDTRRHSGGGTHNPLAVGSRPTRPTTSISLPTRRIVGPSVADFALALIAIGQLSAVPRRKVSRSSALWSFRFLKTTRNSWNGFRRSRFAMSLPSGTRSRASSPSRLGTGISHLSAVSFKGVIPFASDSGGGSLLWLPWTGDPDEWHVVCQSRHSPDDWIRTNRSMTEVMLELSISRSERKPFEVVS